MAILTNLAKYGENDNFATLANKAKHKAMRVPIKVGDTGEFGKYGEYDNFSSFRTSLSYNTLTLDLWNRFEFINLLSLLIFIKSNRCILEVKQDR